MPFDPATYIAQKSSDQSGSFNPAQYVQEKSSAPAEDNNGYMDSAKSFGKGMVNNLPAIGGIIGGIAGTPMDAVAGPMGNVIGAGIGGYAGTAAKNLINNYIDPANAPKTMSQTITEPIVGGAEQAAMQGAGEIASPYISRAAGYVADKAKAAKSMIGTAAGRVGEELTGMNKALTKRYFENTDKINQLIDTYGENTADHAADTRTGWNAIIQSKKASLNNQISQALKTAPIENSLDVTPVIQRLEESKANLNPDTHGDAIAETGTVTPVVDR